MKEQTKKTNRRTFIKSSAVIGGSVALNLGFTPLRQKNPTLKVGLIGCGGRGTGAAAQALKADPDVVLTTMADVFPDRLEEAYSAIHEAVPERVKVKNDQKFIGFEAYKQVMETDVDVVLLTTPPSFRPYHLMAAVEAGKHVFCEKPVAVDAYGVRKVLEAAKKAKEKNLSLVSGFCFRYSDPNRAFVEKVHADSVGEIMTISSTRNGGELWSKPRQPEWTDMEYQMRNWYYYHWLSGDHIVEQAVHSIDLMAWAMGDQMPVKATGTGGRQIRVDPIFGNIYDHFAIEYEYANGAKGYHFCRQQNGCAPGNTLDIAGTNGRATLNLWQGLNQITGANPWKYDGEKNDMYQTEHDELFASIRANKPMNDGTWMASSTMMAILGRMVAYSGQTITWDEAFNSDLLTGPENEKFAWDLKWPGPGVAMPGTTKVL